MSFKYVTLRIPTRNKLKKYLLTQFLTEPIVVTKKDRIGNYINRLVQKGGTFKKHPDEFETELIFYFPVEYLTRNGCYLSPQAIRDFNDFLQREFTNDLYNYLEVALTYNPEMEIKEAIFDFMGKYDLDEKDIAYDSLKRAYLRDRKRRQSLETQKI